MLILTFSFGCSQSKQVESLEVYSLPLSILTRSDVTVESIKTMSATKKTAITNIEIIEKINTELSLLTNSKNEYENFDIRVYCIIKYNDGTNEEVRINGIKDVLYKGSTLKATEQLLNYLKVNN